MQNQDNIDNIYNIIRYLGKGSLSKVYLVRNVNNNTEYAARIRIRDVNHFHFQQELQMTTNASNLNNPNIIHLINYGLGTITIKGNVQNKMNYLILDYCSKGDLYNYFKFGRFSERHAKFIFRKILNGVRALHGAGICHRNLKLQNILLDQNFNPKISNFAFATLFQVNNGIIQLNDRIGTIPYMPPQMFNNQPYNGSMADIFSLGVILFNLVTGRFGFNKADNHDPNYQFIRNNLINQYWNNLANEINNINNLSQEFKDLYISMVSPNENNRPPTIDQILNNNWFNDLVGLNDAQLNQLEIEVLNEFQAREKQVHMQLAVNLEEEGLEDDTR